MKRLIVGLFAALSTLAASAQKHNLFADGGICFSRINPGLSATYNYKPLKFLGVGAGIQAYDFFPTITNGHQYIPALFADLRLTVFPGKKNQVFFFYNLGIDFYKHTNTFYADETVIYNVPRDNGTYTGVGIGYFHRTTPRGGGFYISVKTVSNGYMTNAYDLVAKEQYEEKWSRGSLVLAGGFKFGFGEKNFTEQSTKVKTTDKDTE